MRRPRNQVVHFPDEEINAQGDFSRVTGWEVAELRPDMPGSVSGLSQPLREGNDLESHVKLINVGSWGKKLRQSLLAMGTGWRNSWDQEVSLAVKGGVGS